MREFSIQTVSTVRSMLAKARLLMLFVALAVVAMIWADQITRGLFG